jgi:hypothetical protein
MAARARSSATDDAREEDDDMPLVLRCCCCILVGAKKVDGVKAITTPMDAAASTAAAVLLGRGIFESSLSQLLPYRRILVSWFY